MRLQTSLFIHIKLQSIRKMGALLLCILSFSALQAEEIMPGDTLSKPALSVGDSLRLKHRIMQMQRDSAMLHRTYAKKDTVTDKSVSDTNLGDQLYYRAFDSLSTMPDMKIIYKYNNSKRAVIYSMILPGLGQVYNKKYWKLPIIYGGAAALYFFYDYNNQYYQRFKSAYTQRVDYETLKSEYSKQITAGNPLPPWEEYNPVTDTEMQGFSRDGLAQNRDFYRRNRDYNVIFFALLYVANIVDAMVDSYMLYYDVSDQLAFEVEPFAYPSYSFNTDKYTTNCGVTLKLNLK